MLADRRWIRLLSVNIHLKISRQLAMNLLEYGSDRIDILHKLTNILAQ
jgi:hypothetical protein